MTLPEETRCRGRRLRFSLLELQLQGDDMRRDDDLLRALMLELERDPEPVVLVDYDAVGSDEDRRKYYHLRLLADAGFLEETGTYGGAFRITNDGHDFIALMANEGLWRRMKDKAREVGPGYGLRLLFEIGNALLRSKARDLGLTLD